jgi:Raf kinase inhibitor-like YbhB/YbcL family protein
MNLDRTVAPDPYDLLPPVASFELTSDDVTDGQPLDLRHVHTSANGENLSPHLAWSGAPAETRGYVVTCYDPDAPTTSGFWHWLLLNVPASVTELPRDASSNPPAGTFHVRNDFGQQQYDGAAPPEGDRTHRYIFAVHALDVETLDLDASATPAYVGFNLTFHTLARATLRPTFAR